MARGQGWRSLVLLAAVSFVNDVSGLVAMVGLLALRPPPVTGAGAVPGHDH